MLFTATAISLSKINKFNYFKFNLFALMYKLSVRRILKVGSDNGKQLNNVNLLLTKTILMELIQ